MVVVVVVLVVLVVILIVQVVVVFVHFYSGAFATFVMHTSSFRVVLKTRRTEDIQKRCWWTNGKNVSEGVVLWRGKKKEEGKKKKDTNKKRKIENEMHPC